MSNGRRHSSAAGGSCHSQSSCSSAPSSVGLRAYETRPNHVGARFTETPCSWQAGVGAHLPITDSLDVIGIVSYVSAEVDAGLLEVDDDGYGAELGLRGRIGRVELEGSVSYVDLDEGGDDTSAGVDARYYFSDIFAIGVSADTGDDVTTYAIGVRLEF